jgi:hypothetical protein
MFIRIFSSKQDSEILINVNSIWKIEVRYGVVSSDPHDPWAYSTSVEHGAKDANAMRFYRLFVGGDNYLLAAEPGSKVAQVIEDIYRNAIKDETPATPEEPPEA